jgi:hypothetical protein
MTILPSKPPASRPLSLAAAQEREDGKRDGPTVMSDGTVAVDLDPLSLLCRSSRSCQRQSRLGFADGRDVCIQQKARIASGNGGQIFAKAGASLQHQLPGVALEDHEAGWALLRNTDNGAKPQRLPTREGGLDGIDDQQRRKF